LAFVKNFETAFIQNTVATVSSREMLANCRIFVFSNDSDYYLYVYIIDQARGQDGWILPELSLCAFMDRDEVEVHQNAEKKNEANTHAAILTELTWSIKDLLYGIKNKLNRLRISSGKRQTSWQLRS